MATTDTMQLHSAGEEPKPRFDYRGRHRYLITLETFEAKPLFAGSELVRAVLGALRDESLAHHFEVLIYSFLPSNLTLLVRGKEEGSHMKTFLAAFRAASAMAIAADPPPRLWKRTYRERVLRKTEELRKVIQDVAMIPVRAGLASSPLAYEFQGSFVDELRSLLPAPPRRPDAVRPIGSPGYKPRTGGFKPGSGGFKPGYKPRTGGFKPGSGGFKPGSPGYKPRTGGFQPGSGGFKSGSPGYKPRTGGFQPGSGGFKPGSPGYKPRTGGFQPGSGGFKSGSPGYKPRTGGFQSGSGGFKPGSPGYKPRTGGFQSGSGGFKPGSPGYKPRTGGFKPGSGGFKSGSPGYKPRTGGFKPGSGGFKRSGRPPRREGRP